MNQTEKATVVEVIVNRRELELHRREVTGSQLLDAAGFEGAGWELFELHGEHDPTGGQLVQADAVLHLKNHERFRVIPGNRTFGGC
jgi:multiubiquitin